MTRIIQYAAGLRLPVKLTILLTVFAMIPMAIVGWLAFAASHATVDTIGQQFEYAAVNMADTIDRNLFERYGDVQAFGLNTAVAQTNHWYVAEEGKSPIVQVMNQYVDTYDIYFLTLLVDLKGRLIAVNTKDADGKPIETKALYANDYSTAPWFHALKAKSFTTKMPFTAPGNDVSTGTLIEDLHLDKDVRTAYQGKDGMVLGFSAPVYQNGQVVAYWSNRAKFSLVEDIVKAGAEDLKATAGGDTEITVLDSNGRIIVDYDPVRTGSDKIVRDFDVLMKLNLVEKGLAVAQKAVKGARGYENAVHARKQIVQASGYTHLKGAMGFPGMNWSILVRVPLDQAAAGSYKIQRHVLVSGILCLLLVIPTGFFVGKKVVVELNTLLASMQRFKEGDRTARTTVYSTDEVGFLAKVFNAMGETLARDIDSAAQYEATIEAIGQVQAMIEFSMDGIVTGANENFCRIFGYRVNEIQGQHHRMFCSAASTGTAEYSAFWAKLNRGEADVGIYRRLGKGGEEIWIQASYNPIPDAQGELIKVVEFAVDITADKKKSVEFEGKINAIDKSQAAIEFNLDGTVRTANENFCTTFGYGVEEIKGQHHRMFCEPAYTNRPEYAALWAKLNRGEFDAGIYKHLGKGHKEVWIQASYNPILDVNGQVYKVVKYAIDVTAQKMAEAERQAAQEVMEQLVAEAQGVLGRLAGNDLTEEMSGTYPGELEKIKSSINAVVRNLTHTLTTVREAVEAVSTGAEQITKGNEDLSQRTSEQASSLEETSSTMEEMTSTVKQNADNAKQANQLAIAARNVAEKGGSVTTKAIDAMSEINKSSKKIADIITVIDEIAFQTNLLALNAAVEAARAGEHGRGFAVVAAEVRNLAQRSATAAKEIKGLINESVQRVTDGSELVTQSGKTLEEIVGSVKRVTDIIAEITAASQEQASGIDQVNKAIMQMDETTQQNAALVEEATSASQSMKEQARELMTQVASFKMTDNGGTGSVSHRTVPAPLGRGQTPRVGAPKGVSPHKKPTMSAPGTSQPTSVAAGNGKDRRKKDSEFEEF